MPHMHINTAVSDKKNKKGIFIMDSRYRFEFLKFLPIVIITWLMNIIMQFLTTTIDPSMLILPKLATTMVVAIRILAVLATILFLIMAVFSIIDSFLTPSSDGEYNPKYIKLLYLDSKQRKKYIKIDIRHLSNKTKDIVRSNTETALDNLYQLAQKYDKEDLFITFEGHINLIASELSESVKACQTPEMEELLMQKLTVVTQTLNYMEKEIKDEITADEAEKAEVKKLTEKILMEDYHPMERLEIFNNLLKEDKQ